MTTQPTNLTTERSSSRALSMRPSNFQMTVIFTELAGKTLLTWRMLHETAAKCDEVRSFVVEANEQNFDRLEAELRGHVVDVAQVLDDVVHGARAYASGRAIKNSSVTAAYSSR